MVGPTTDGRWRAPKTSATPDLWPGSWPARTLTLADFVGAIRDKARTAQAPVTRHVSRGRRSRCCSPGLRARVVEFVLIDDKWPDGTVTMQLQLGTPARALSDGSSSWGAVAESALGEWNGIISRLQFNAVRDSSSAKGDGNGVNNVFFSNDIYGMAFETSVLAVTTN